MPKIKLEFSIPEDPTRGTVEVIIQAPDQKRVVAVAFETIEHYTGVKVWP